MTREELTTWLRSFQTPSMDAAADLLDQQAVRIAKLEARADAAEREWGLCEQQRVKAYWRGRRDGWIEGRDAAAEAVERAPTVNVQAQKGPGWEVLVATPTVPYPQMIRALNPPEPRS